MYIFVIQALGIALEALLISLLRGLGLTGGFYTRRVVGYIWVISWFRISAADFIDAQVRGGAGSSGYVPASVSIVRPLLDICGVSI